MAVHKYNPTSAGRRGATVIRDPELSRGKPEKSLLITLKRNSGRNAYGRITSRRRGGGHKRRYRVIDWRRVWDGVPAKVASIEYDPYRSARIALLHYVDGRKTYVIAPLGLEVGAELTSGPAAEPRIGNTLPLSRVPLGAEIHCVELHPGRGAQLGRSAGCVIRLASREGNDATLILPSGEMRRVHVDCRATMGQVGNGDHALVSIGKAGRNRHKGRRPKVRGSAMNPYSHPLGGGEGRTGAGREPCSPWGKLSKGGKTRNPRKNSSRMIVRKRKKK